MAWVEVYGGQRSLVFELTTARIVVYSLYGMAKHSAWVYKGTLGSAKA